MTMMTVLDKDYNHSKSRWYGNIVSMVKTVNTVINSSLDFDVDNGEDKAGGLEVSLILSTALS